MLINSAVLLLDMAAKNTPDAIYVQEGSDTVTYCEMRDRARIMASLFLEKGSSRRPILVYMPKGINTLTVFFAALYAGSPYVPIDAGVPLTRLQKIINNLNPAFIVTMDNTGLDELEMGNCQVLLMDSLLSGKLDEAAMNNMLSQVIDTDPIYIMYTSGSTGEPKGVTIAHRGIIDYARWVVNTFDFNQSTVMANQAPFYFDNSTFDIYGTLMCGGKLIFIPESLLMFPSKLPAFLEENKITSIFWVPTVIINVAVSGSLEGVDLPFLKTVAFCGEVMPNSALNIWRHHLPNCLYANLYGPTEITDVCCYYIIDRKFADHEPLPIGRACENMRILILDENCQEVKNGQQGEICVVGSGVGLGYWNKHEITKNTFVTTASGDRIYKTGDLGYFDENGEIMFIGRKDTQIKLKGNRIELGDIEAAAICLDGIDRACALFQEEKQEIVLFAETDDELSLRKVRLSLKQYIPGYMLPGRLVCMRSFPMTSNDKIDRVLLRGSL